MTIAKSLPQNVKIVDGNAVQVYVDEPSGIIYLKDIYGRIEPLSNYLTTNGQVLANVGTGAEVFLENTGLPAYLRTLKQGANVVITENANEIEIAVPSVTGIPLYYGSFFSTQTQTTVGNEQKAMTFNNTDATATLGTSIVSNSRITVANAGIYNIAFSAQLLRTSGGQAQQIYIYLKKNGNIVPDSNTAITLANNGHLVVAAWNFFLQLNAGQYVEIFWYATAATIQLHYDASPVVGLPAIPSVIATINRVG